MNWQLLFLFFNVNFFVLGALLKFLAVRKNKAKGRLADRHPMEEIPTRKVASFVYITFSIWHQDSNP